MIQNSSKQTGSAHVIILTIVVFVILGALGFVFWNNFLNKKAPTVVSQQNTASSEGAVQKTQHATQELKIDDWSIKFTVPAGLAVNDIYYYKTHVGEGPDYYGFTTNRIREEGGACDNQVTGNLVTITRLTSKSGMGMLINEVPINGYYFYSDTSNGGITPTPECLKSNAANSDRSLLEEMVKSLAFKGESVISADPSSGYLVFADWGVKFKLPKDTSEVRAYKEVVSNQNGNFEEYDLTTKRVEELGQQCVPDAKGYVIRLSSITRRATKLEQYSSAFPANDNEPINGYYYYVSGGQATCSDQHTDWQSADNIMTSDLLSKPVAVE